MGLDEHIIIDERVDVLTSSRIITSQLCNLSKEQSATDLSNLFRFTLTACEDGPNGFLIGFS